MFVSKTKHERELAESHLTAMTWKLAHATLLSQWNTLVRRINEHGGEGIFDKPEPQKQFTAEDVATLIFLCHPDKHNGSKTAGEMTVRLLKLRGT